MYTPPSVKQRSKFKGFRAKQPKHGPLIIQAPVVHATKTFLEQNAYAACSELGAKAAELLPKVFDRARRLIQEARARAELIGVKE